MTESVLCCFPIQGKACGIEVLSGGKINNTWCVTTDAGRRYVLQRLNSRVLPNAEIVMENISAISLYIKEQGGDYPIIGFLSSLDGGLLHRDGSGDFWRVYPFVENSICLKRAETPQDVYQCGLAYGGFLEALSDFPADKLKESIEGFHDTAARYAKLKSAIMSDAFDRLRYVKKETAMLLEREERACRLNSMRRKGELPLRVTHNDTKLSNVLFDRDSREALCVIDLDTVMPGLAAFDFGDAVRSCARTDMEVGTALLSLERFKSFSEGFLRACPSLTEAEIESLVPGTLTITLELSLRYLTDYLEGDIYFEPEFPEQNRMGCENMLSLLLDMEKKERLMQLEINKIRACSKGALR